MSDYQTRPRHKEDMKYRMPLRTTDYVDVIARATELGIRAPVGIALLPGNFSTAARRRRACARAGGASG